MNKATTSVKDFTIQFWGVRGKIATPGKETIRYGGNTSCLEIGVGGKCLIFDGGTGLRELGNHLLKRMPVEAHMFFTHCHWDRIQGFPFFVPAFIPGNCFHIYGGEASNGSSFQQRLSSQMLGPSFPVPMSVMQSELKFNQLVIGEKQCLGGVTIDTEFLNYKHRSIGYRVSCQGKSVVYATDTEKCSAHLHKNLLNLAKDADVLILDAPDPEDVKDANQLSSDWSKAFWQTSIETAKVAGVKRIVMSTHNPDHDDQFLEQLEGQVQSEFPNTCLAREGMIVSLGS
ncbi:MAG: MBL fold metallo-hydrolase [Moorea sp. SIO2B7]|nr:MBL fold metallo-hydrolase [Moorena sp. SIO2B7]